MNTDHYCIFLYICTLFTVNLFAAFVCSAASLTDSSLSVFGVMVPEKVLRSPLLNLFLIIPTLVAIFVIFDLITSTNTMNYTWNPL